VAARATERGGRGRTAGLKVSAPGGARSLARAPGAVGDAIGSRERIVEEAIALLADHGYPGMSLQEIADRVGMRKSSLFFHFPSKQDLASAAYRVVTQEFVDLLAGLAAPGAASLDQLERAIDGAVDFAVAHPSHARLGMRLFVDQASQLREVQPEQTDDPLVRLFLVFGGWLERARRARVVRSLDPRQAMLHLFGLLLFYPAVSQTVGPHVLGADPFSPAAVRAWKRELVAFVRGGLAA